MTTFPNSPRLLKRGLVLIDPETSAFQRVIILQHNPDTISRTLQVQGGQRKRRPLPAPAPERAPIETMKLDAEIDATDQLEFPELNPDATILGIHPQLAALETLVYPPSSRLIENNRQAGSGTLEILPVVQVDTIDTTEMTVTLRLQDGSGLFEDYPEDSPKHPLLRRWDHEKGDTTEQDEPELAEHDGALYVDEGKWPTLEDGVQILFEKSNSNGIVHNYQRGDYWLVPARTATGDVEWPEDAQGAAVLLPPHGIDHHYAPLAVISRERPSNEDWVPEDCRCWIKKTLNPPCGQNEARREQ